MAYKNITALGYELGDRLVDFNIGRENIIGALRTAHPGVTDFTTDQIEEVIKKFCAESLKSLDPDLSAVNLDIQSTAHARDIISRNIVGTAVFDDTTIEAALNDVTLLTDHDPAERATTISRVRAELLVRHPGATEYALDDIERVVHDVVAVTAGKQRGDHHATNTVSFLDNNAQLSVEVVDAALKSITDQTIGYAVIGSIDTTYGMPPVITMAQLLREVFNETGTNTHPDFVNVQNSLVNQELYTIADVSSMLRSSIEPAAPAQPLFDPQNTDDVIAYVENFLEMTFGDRDYTRNEVYTSIQQVLPDYFAGVSTENVFDNLYENATFPDNALETILTNLSTTSKTHIIDSIKNPSIDPNLLHDLMWHQREIDELYADNLGELAAHWDSVRRHDHFAGLSQERKKECNYDYSNFYASDMSEDGFAKRRQMLMKKMKGLNDENKSLSDRQEKFINQEGENTPGYKNPPNAGKDIARLQESTEQWVDAVEGAFELAGIFIHSEKKMEIVNAMADVARENAADMFFAATRGYDPFGRQQDRIAEKQYDKDTAAYKDKQLDWNLRVSGFKARHKYLGKAVPSLAYIKDEEERVLPTGNDEVVPFEIGATHLLGVVTRQGGRPNSPAQKKLNNLLLGDPTAVPPVYGYEEKGREFVTKVKELTNDPTISGNPDTMYLKVRDLIKEYEKYGDLTQVETGAITSLLTTYHKDPDNASAKLGRFSTALDGRLRNNCARFDFLDTQLDPQQADAFKLTGMDTSQNISFKTLLGIDPNQPSCVITGMTHNNLNIAIFDMVSDKDEKKAEAKRNKFATLMDTDLIYTDENKMILDEKGITTHNHVAKKPEKKADKEKSSNTTAPPGNFPIRALKKAYKQAKQAVLKMFQNIQSQGYAMAHAEIHFGKKNKNLVDEMRKQRRGESSPNKSKLKTAMTKDKVNDDEKMPQAFEHTKTYDDDNSANPDSLEAKLNMTQANALNFRLIKAELAAEKKKVEEDIKTAPDEATKKQLEVRLLQINDSIESATQTMQEFIALNIEITAEWNVMEDKHPANTSDLAKRLEKVVEYQPRKKELESKAAVATLSTEEIDELSKLVKYIQDTEDLMSTINIDVRNEWNAIDAQNHADPTKKSFQQRLQSIHNGCVSNLGIDEARNKYAAYATPTGFKKQNAVANMINILGSNDDLTHPETREFFKNCFGINNPETNEMCRDLTSFIQTNGAALGTGAASQEIIDKFNEFMLSPKWHEAEQEMQRYMKDQSKSNL